MSKVLERIVAHAAPDKIRRLEVPEWGEPAQTDEKGEVVTPGVPLVITYTMVTLDDMATVDEADGDAWYKRAARIVALKARDEAGKPLFSLGDAVTLREQASPQVVNRIAMAMLGGVTTLEQAVKN